MVRDRTVQVVRILPFRHGPGWNQEEHPVASRALKIPEEEMDREQFFSSRVGDLSRDIAVDAVIDSRRDR